MDKLENRVKGNFTIIPNQLINDPDLSITAKALYQLFASKPKAWTFYNSVLMKETKFSKKTLNKYIDELVSCGWMTKSEQKIVNGRFSGRDYILYENRRKNRR